MAQNKGELDELMPVVYDELRRLAQKYLSRERADHTLQTTALVHEAYLRLVDQKAVNWQNRAQFFGIAAQMMRRILINHAKERQTKKRQGYSLRVSLDEAVNFFEKADLDLTALDETLNELAALDAQQAQIVELRFFGGLTIEEVSEVLEISPATTKREWDSAKLWLRRRLGNRRKSESLRNDGNKRSRCFRTRWNSTRANAGCFSIPLVQTTPSCARRSISCWTSRLIPRVTFSSSVLRMQPAGYALRVIRERERGSVRSRSCVRSATAGWVQSIWRNVTTNITSSRWRSS
jgi:RNA polymerase sigma factor (TIGR02999 family)